MQVLNLCPRLWPVKEDVACFGILEVSLSRLARYDILPILVLDSDYLKAAFKVCGIYNNIQFRCFLV